MTRTQEAACLGVAAGLGLMLALSIPEPSPTMGQKSPNSRQERIEGFGTAIGTFGPLRAPSDVYGARVVAVDGDSLTVNGQKVRLFGIDAPEITQTCLAAGRSWACGEASAISLRGMVERDPAVTCERKDTDRYGRMVAVCRNGKGEDMGGLQVARGLAVAYTRYSLAYSDHEAAAKADKLGMWAGTFTLPETWRRENRR